MALSGLRDRGGRVSSPSFGELQCLEEVKTRGIFWSLAIRTLGVDVDVDGEGRGGEGGECCLRDRDNFFFQDTFQARRMACFLREAKASEGRVVFFPVLRDSVAASRLGSEVGTFPAGNSIVLESTGRKNCGVTDADASSKSKSHSIMSRRPCLSSSAFFGPSSSVVSSLLSAFLNCLLFAAFLSSISSLNSA